MRKIGLKEIEDIALGAALLGAGGGGDPYVGKLVAIGAVKECGEVTMLSVDEVPDDALIVPIAMMGAPTILSEKAVGGSEYKTLYDMVTRFYNKEIFAFMPIEAGGVNSMLPIAAAARLNLPLIDAEALAKVQSHVADALEKGARLLTGGRPHARGGNFFEPTVLADVTPAMRVAREETFGPVAPLFRFDTEAEGIQMANATEYGLAAYFYTRDVARCFRVSEALEYGMVGINTGLISNEVAPFGGIKQSGLGREGSRHGLDEYLELKYLCFDLN